MRKAGLKTLPAVQGIWTWVGLDAKQNPFSPPKNSPYAWMCLGDGKPGQNAFHRPRHGTVSFRLIIPKKHFLIAKKRLKSKQENRAMQLVVTLWLNTFFWPGLGELDHSP